MKLTQRGPLPSTNYTVGREGQPIQYIVIHTMVGSLASADALFHSVGHQTSAHFGISASEGYQWVADADTAYHSGNWTMNTQSIGIEHEDNGDYNGVRPDQLYTNSAEMVRYLCGKYNIPITRQYILRHKEVPGASTACPDALDIERIVREANGGPVVVVTTPDVSIPAGVPGLVYDTPDNDRSFLDYNTVAFVPGQIADIGLGVRWDRAKLVSGKWLLGIKDSTWALYDDCVDDTDATHDAAHSSPPEFVTAPVKPPVVVPPVVVPPVKPPVVVPPVVVPPVDEATSFWAALFAWLKKFFGGKSNGDKNPHR